MVGAQIVPSILSVFLSASNLNHNSRRDHDSKIHQHRVFGIALLFFRLFQASFVVSNWCNLMEAFVGTLVD